MPIDEDHKDLFHVADYAVFAVMLAISAFIGIYYACSGSKQKTTDEFLMGGRSLSVFPVSMSILASFMSAITLLGTPAEIYQYGTQYWIINLAFIIVMPATAYCYLPVYYNLNITSAYEYLELRFNRLIRTLGSSVFTIHMIMYMPIVLYAPALALSEVTGLNLWVSVLSIGIVCTFYTSIGGMKAVVWTDLFQTLLMYAAMFVVVFKGIADLGGSDIVWRRNLDGKRIEFFNFELDPTVRHTFWSLFFGGYFTWMGNYAANQAIVQRYLTLPSLNAARRCLWINVPGLIILITITTLAGLVIYALYYDCDPIQTNYVGATDQLFPRFVMQTLGFLPGLPGLFVSGIFSGALSTVSSGVNSLAAVTLEDIIKAYVVKDISEVWATRVTKITAFVYGVLAIVLVFVAQQLGGVLQAALSIHGMVGGPMLGLFSLGMIFPWTNSLATGLGLLSGFVASFWIGMGAFVHKPYHPKAPLSVSGCIDYFNNVTTTNVTVYATNATFYSPESNGEEVFVLYRLSYMWYSAIGCIVCVVIGLIVSFISGPTKPSDVDNELISPVYKALYISLPTNMQKYFKLRGYEVKKKDVIKEELIMTQVTRSEQMKEGITNISFTPENEMKQNGMPS
ncbi:sodium-coupled monocarboxylate transporter 1-like [Centruroides vittatus]|uniref:sodium-coupled monocarboxylate transporter 1-like n=1 Tax=Centruroides vittatus TaxID=120091 RepID=UPI00350ED656